VLDVVVTIVVVVGFGLLFVAYTRSVAISILNASKSFKLPPIGKPRPQSNFDRAPLGEEYQPEENSYSSSFNPDRCRGDTR
jgi:hypothetical protein